MMLHVHGARGLLGRAPVSRLVVGPLCYLLPAPKQRPKLWWRARVVWLQFKTSLGSGGGGVVLILMPERAGRTLLLPLRLLARQ